MRSAQDDSQPSLRPGRVGLIALVLIPPNAYWIIQMERVRQGPYVTSISLFFNVVFIILAITLLNGLLRRWTPRHALTQPELITIYSMLAVASALAGMDMMQGLLMVMTHSTWFATPENNWDGLFARYPPHWLLIDDKGVLQSYYQGNSTLYRWDIIRAWIGPAAWWLGFIVALLFVLMCVSVILRKQWMDHERLTFPIVQLPLEMTRPGMDVFRSKLLWIGFAVAAVVDTLNGLSYFYPAVPAINISNINLRTYIAVHPWTAIDWMPLTFYPAVIGLSFLLPVDLLFSCWFFYFFWKLQRVVSRAFAWDVVPQFPFIDEQGFGAYMGIVAALLWIGRRYLRQVGRKIAGRPSELDDSHEALSYRQAAIGLALGIGALGLFCWRTGMTPGMIAAFFVVYLALAVAVTRVRAEFGSPVHDFHMMGPDRVLPVVLGSEAIGRRDLSMFAVFWWFNRAYRSHPMPHQLEGLYLARRTRANARAFMWCVMVAVPVGALSALWAYTHLAYTLGVSAKFWSGYGYGGEAFSQLETWLTAPEAPNFKAITAMAFGFGAAALLTIMRAQFLWWPFHPVGYAISGSWSINLVWTPMLIAWAIKLGVLRYGGLRLYRRALPFFLGLILGETVAGCGWSLIGIAWGIPTYSFWGR
ncbi:MAG: hypothetical protein JSV65_04180 [Armatimonadota bacterium]|nr:MAG: hypothetical protein JSV65_04180 [Armatimonadota bacterium]